MKFKHGILAFCLLVFYLFGLGEAGGMRGCLLNVFGNIGAYRVASLQQNQLEHRNAANTGRHTQAAPRPTPHALKKEANEKQQ